MKAARRGLVTVALSLGFCALVSAGVEDLTSKDAAGGLRAALGQGIETAVAHLGSPDGFLKDPKVTIPLPSALEKADRALRMVGMGGDADNLKVAMNHAAEMAVGEAKPVFTQALHHMTLSDAKAILTGGETAGTDYFRKATSATLTAKFLPVVARQTEKLQLASQYDRVAGKAAELGLVSAQDANVNQYVTAKALDGLFSTIADEERAIRKNPMAQASSLIKKVFGAIR
ncbi:MAG TPA: DUF4197 domain-containing protein [Steroidobacteraceae bacterium]